jgi:thiosulfate/3-mercaptopyruvate sulfurtransferase
MKKTLLVLASLLIVLSSFAATPREQMVVDAAWLQKHLHDPDLVLLQVGDKESFAAAHIPGAHAITGHDVVVHESPEGLYMEMPAADDLRKRLEALGISDRSRIIAYYAKDWLSPTTRLIFTLDYAGLGARTSILDGGLAAWTRAGGAVTKDVPVQKTGTLSPLKIKPLIVDAATVKARIGAPGYRIVDGRNTEFYTGKNRTGDHDDQARAGHIPGAGNIPFTDVVDDDNFLKPTGELRAMFDKAGVKPHDTVIGYCHIGMQATAVLFAARILGHPVVLYDGSFQDWSRHKTYPVELPK